MAEPFDFVFSKWSLLGISIPTHPKKNHQMTYPEDVRSHQMIEG